MTPNKKCVEEAVKWLKVVKTYEEDGDNPELDTLLDLTKSYLLGELGEEPRGAQFRRVEEQQKVIERYRLALEKLARLGNGNEYGNSDGNCIAQEALKELK